MKVEGNGISKVVVGLGGAGGPGGGGEGEGGGRRIWRLTVVLPEQTTSAGAASVRGALCIDKIHTPEMPQCATGSMRLVS